MCNTINCPLRTVYINRMWILSVRRSASVFKIAQTLIEVFVQFWRLKIKVTELKTVQMTIWQIQIWQTLYTLNTVIHGSQCMCIYCQYLHDHAYTSIKSIFLQLLRLKLRVLLKNTLTYGGQNISKYFSLMMYYYFLQADQLIS